jgi:hypothetical protein
MPQRDPGVYLEDLEYFTAAAVRFISTYSLEQYLEDVRKQGLQSSEYWKSTSVCRP